MKPLLMAISFGTIGTAIAVTIVFLIHADMFVSILLGWTGGFGGTTIGFVVGTWLENR